MVKLLKRVPISLHLENTKGSADWTTKISQRTRTQSTTFKPKCRKPDRTKDNVFLKPNDDRTYGERVGLTNRLELDTGELKRFRKDAVKWWSNGTAGAISHQGKRNANRGVERTRRAKEMHGEEYHFRSDHVDETTPHHHCDFVPLTKQGNLSAERRDRRQEKMRRTQENFLKQCKRKGASR